MRVRPGRNAAGALALLAVVVIAGCAGFGGVGAGASDGATPATPTVTPVAVPGTATPAAPSPSPTRPARGTARGSPVTQPRYLDLRPTCERPPGLVIHIQVAALRNDDPATHEGINTTWQFASPSNRALTGPYSEFVELITDRYRPLLDAESVTYGPLDLDADPDDGGRASATRRVTVTEPDGTSTTYRWLVTRQAAGRYEGCWMTAGVTTVD